MAKNHVKFQCKCGAVHHLKVIDGEMKHEVDYSRKKKDDEPNTPVVKSDKGKNNRNLVQDFIQGTGPFADEDEADNLDDGSEDANEEGEE